MKEVKTYIDGNKSYYDLKTTSELTGIAQMQLRGKKVMERLNCLVKKGSLFFPTDKINERIKS